MPAKTLAILLISVLLAGGLTAVVGSWAASASSEAALGAWALLPALLLFVLWRWILSRRGE